MKIDEMRVTPVAMADPPLFSSYGLHAPYALRTVVELVSEDGITGAAETHGGERTLAHFAAARSTVIGHDAYDLARLSKEIDRLFSAPSLPSPPRGASAEASQTFVLPGENTADIALRVFGAVEVAALDLIGKATGVPVCDLLGGRIRDEVPFSAYLFYKRAGGGGVGTDAREDHWGETLEAVAVVRQAQEMVAAYGFGSIKLKGGVFPPEQEIEAILALREAFGPDVPLRIDPNGAWSVETSIRVGTALAGALEYLEDPTPGLDGMAAVRQGLRAAGVETLLASNNALTSFADLPVALAGGSAQVILSDHHYWGGLRAVTQLGRLCETFGIGLSMHSNSHLGLSLLAMVHLAAATPHLTYASDTHYPWQGAEDEILVGGRVAFQGGAVPVPTAPGLGAELDRDAVARGKERYERCDYRNRDDEAEMRRHVDPSWRRLAPRW
ncbi:MAG: glucarate dehydratase [Thermomicrobiales bacterium]|jgi:glucarate dehydratase|nr:glucarate dehydratase [Thermomicrobiales bacterium]